MVLSGASMVEGQLFEEKHGNLRRQLQDESSGINLGTAVNFALLTKTGVTTTGVTSVDGDIGTSPITSAALTGFGLIKDSGNTFSTSSLVTGKAYAADYDSPTPDSLIVAVLDMQAAYAEAADLINPDSTDLGGGTIEGYTLAPGLYKWGTNVGFTSSLTFNGSETDVWILQIEKDLVVGSGAIVTLSGGAKAENIYWQIAGGAVFGTTSHLEGVFLCKAGIVFQTGSSLNGAALAQTAVTLDATTIVKTSV